jgi:phage shock protein A
MPYFSRLTDIVTCNLTQLLQAAEEPRAALQEIIREMQEGVAGAQRSARTAESQVLRIESEVAEQRQQLQYWLGEARKALQANDETTARRAILRKQEAEDLLAGLEQQLQAAIATRQHLNTVLHALEARLADAQRRLEAPEPLEAVRSVPAGAVPTTTRGSRVDAELDLLRKELGNSK